MPRPKIKDSTAVTFRINNYTLNKLNDFCNVTGQTKTVAVERAIEEYVKSYEDIVKKLETKYGN